MSAHDARIGEILKKSQLTIEGAFSSGKRVSAAFALERIEASVAFLEAGNTGCNSGCNSGCGGGYSAIYQQSL